MPKQQSRRNGKQAKSKSIERRFEPALELLRLITKLESVPRSGIKVQDLASDLGYPERKVYRMLNAIRKPYGLTSDKGLYNLPRPRGMGEWPNGPEQEKIFTACFIAGALSDTPFVPSVNQLRERFSLLRHRPLLDEPPSLSVALPSSWPIRYGDFEDKIGTLRKALRNHHVVKIQYTSASKRTTGNRLIDPHDFYFDPRAGLLALFARCHEEGRIRPFMVHRISEAEDTDRSFRRDERFSVEDEIEKRFNLSAGKPVEIRLRFVADVIPFVKERLLRQYQKFVQLEDGRVELCFTGPYSDAVISFVLSFGPNVEVVAPKILRMRVAAVLRTAAALYQP